MGNETTSWCDRGVQTQLHVEVGKARNMSNTVCCSQLRRNELSTSLLLSVVATCEIDSVSFVNGRPYLGISQELAASKCFQK